MDIDEFMRRFLPYLSEGGMTIFSGAGLSTASGLRDFRGENGLYKENVDGVKILSHEFFEKHPLEFYKFFREYLIADGIKPNLMHEMIAKLQQDGLIRGVITQNIDGLDTEAGTRDVVELHGNANKFYCVDCKKKYSLSDIIDMDVVPKCECGGIIRPDIVLYDENVSDNLMRLTSDKLIYSNSVLVLGTELTTDPAAKLIRGFIGEKSTYMGRHKKLFIVNKGTTSYDYFSDYRYEGDIIEVAEGIKKYVKGA